MNKEHVKIAINVMTRVRDRGDELNMTHWQCHYGTPMMHTEDDANRCGTACCFAGWLAISSEFEAKGGTVLTGGRPSYDGFSGELAISKFLGISVRLAERLTAMTEDVDITHRFYQVRDIRSITPQHVIDRLELILKGELS